MHRCSDFHVNGALQIFYDDDDDEVQKLRIPPHHPPTRPIDAMDTFEGAIQKTSYK